MLAGSETGTEKKRGHLVVLRSEHFLTVTVVVIIRRRSAGPQKCETIVHYELYLQHAFP